MTQKGIIKAVTAQIINMLVNDVLNEYGTESFIGWLEDGEVFYNNGMIKEDVEKAMTLARQIADNLDTITCNYLNITEID